MKNPALAIANMRENIRRDLPQFIGRASVANEMIPVCGGPSLRSRLQSVRSRQKRGGQIFACNGAGRYLKQNGIAPDVIAFVDPAPVVEGFIDDGLMEPIYLVASICSPCVFDRLKGKKVVVWHPDLNIEEQKEILDAYPEKPSVLIGGGNTIGLRMLNVGYLMGFRSFHFYGLDGSFAEDGTDHAYVKHDGPEDGDILTATFNNKLYRGSSWMIEQAGIFLDDQYPIFARAGCRIFVHGEGLIPDMCKALRNVQRKAA